MTYLADVTSCPLCRERWCNVCEVHWADCDCSGPEGTGATVWVRCLVFCLVFFLASPVASQCLKAVPVTAGEAVPCTGILLPMAWARSCAECKKVDLPACFLDRDTEKKTNAVKRTSLLNQISECEVLLDDIEDIADAQPWYHSPALLIGLGALVGVGLTLGVTFAVGQAI